MFKNMRGAALVMVLLILAVASLVGAALLNIGLGDYKEAYTDRDTLQAYYLARSGIEAVRYKLFEDLDNIDTYNAKGTNGIRASFPNGGTVSMTVAGTSAASGVVTIDSTGLFNGFSRHARLVLDIIRQQETNPFKYGLHTLEPLDGARELNILHSDQQYFPIGSNEYVRVWNYGNLQNQDPSEYNPPGPAVPPQILDPADYDGNGIGWTAKEYYDAIPVNSTNYGTANYNAGTGTISGNVTLGTISVANLHVTADSIIVVNRITMTGHLNIDPGVQVTLFVNQYASFTKNGGLINATGEPEQLVIFVADEADNSDDGQTGPGINAEIEFGQNVTVHGYVFAPHADVRFQNGNDVLVGGITCEQFNGVGNVELTYHTFDDDNYEEPPIFSLSMQEREWRD